MQEPDDIRLLRDYAESHSETAFATLVTRHIHKVYSVALRHTSNPHHAEEITQAVFVILAKKAHRLGRGVILSGWLYQTARLASVTFIRGEIRRARREEEAHMQNISEQPALDETWREIAPLLDTAMARLNETDRQAVVLRFFDGKSLRDVGAALGTNEDAAKKRVSRALEKLQRFFAGRGVTSTTAIIAGAISSNSMQAAPVALIHNVTVVAMAQGATASTATLTLIHGALKVMAWSKAQTMVAVGVMVLLAAGTAAITVSHYEEHEAESWEILKANDPQHGHLEFNFPPPQVRIKPSIYTNFVAGSGPGTTYLRRPDGTYFETKTDWQAIGLGEPLQDIVLKAYDAQEWQAIFLAPLPAKSLYDFVSNLTNSTAGPLQALIGKQFGITGHWETMETNVLVLKISGSGARGFKPAESLMHHLNISNVGAFDLFMGTERSIGRTNVFINQTMDSLIKQLWLENEFRLPIVDETGMAGRFDFLFQYPTWYPGYSEQQAWKDALNNQLGLELVPAQRPVKMLVVEKVN